VGTNTFYIIVFSGVFVLALISVLVWALVRIKKQNDLIVAKVEKFKEEDMPQQLNAGSPSKIN
jgi:hypothetical protein